MIFIWIAIFAVLVSVAVTDLPGRVRVAALVLAVVTLWFFWASWGVEHLADTLWPEEASAQLPAPSAAASSAVPAESKTTRLGQVGDLFGGVNALFAALALAGVGVAAHQQWKSTQIAFRQATEATFFSAVALHHRIVDGLRFNREAVFPSARIESPTAPETARPIPQVPYVPSTGRAVFADVVYALAHTEGAPTSYEKTRSNYAKLQTEHNYVLGHYFRNLFQVLKLVDSDAELDEAAKRKYAGLLRAQLSSDELVLLMLNCVDRMVDDGEFRALLVRYRMLEHIPVKKEGGEYLHAGSPLPIVIANEEVIKQYLLPPSLGERRRVYTGAFGTNQSVWMDRRP